MPNLMETELESFGASTIEDFTWKQLLDTDACTMCGRCTCVCPAHATGKPLDPREIVLKTGEVMAATGAAGGLAAHRRRRPRSPSRADSLFERITPEEVWACTSCKACDEICPVNIEILDKILDMRRYLSLMESNFPTELGNAYRSMENSGNPWGMSQGERADWAEGPRRHRRSSTAPAPLRPRVPLLGRLRRQLRRQEPEGHPGHGQAAAAGRHRLRHPRPVRDLHRRPGPALGQRVHLPDARHAERRDAQRHGREEDRHPVPALLQHAAATSTRSSAATTRSSTTASSSSTSSTTGKLDLVRGPARRAGRVPRLLLPRPPQRRVPRAPQGHRLARRHRGRRGAAATAPRACAAAPAAPACGWRRRSARRSTTSAPGADRHRRQRGSPTACPFCYIMIDDGVKGAGQGGRRGQGGRHLHAPARGAGRAGCPPFRQPRGAGRHRVTAATARPRSARRPLDRGRWRVRPGRRVTVGGRTIPNVRWHRRSVSVSIFAGSWAQT